MSDSDQEKEIQRKVEPIRRLKDIQAVKQVLAGNPRNLALFTIGINTNLRAGELVQIRTAQVKGLAAGGAIELADENTGKRREVYLNSACVETIQALIETENLKDEDNLFQSQRGGALTATSINRLVKKWCDAVNLSGNYGAHTLRKTWGYHQYYTFKTDLSSLMAAFNHATQKQTAEYLDLQLNEADNLFDNTL